MVTPNGGGFSKGSVPQIPETFRFRNYTPKNSHGTWKWWFPNPESPFPRGPHFQVNHVCFGGCIVICTRKYTQSHGSHWYRDLPQIDLAGQPANPWWIRVILPNAERWMFTKTMFGRWLVLWYIFWYIVINSTSIYKSYPNLYVCLHNYSQHSLFQHVPCERNAMKS